MSKDGSGLASTFSLGETGGRSHCSHIFLMRGRGAAETELCDNDTDSGVTVTGSEGRA